MTDWLDADERVALAATIDEWLAEFAAETPVVQALERVVDDRPTGGSGTPEMLGDEPRWLLRMTGEDKDFTTVWLTLGQRTLRYETYVMPAPEENAAELYEHVLRRNERLVGAHFSIGIEDAILLRGEVPVAALTRDELDRVIGTLYATVEQCFRALLRIGFASKFR